MKQSRFTQSWIVGVLKQVYAGTGSAAATVN